MIPAYQAEGFVERAVRSVLAQRPWPPAEVLVVDDGSEDGTTAAAERAGARVLRHDSNRGAAAARETGLRAAAHPWVAFLDADDEWLPAHLATLWPLRHGHVLVTGATVDVDEGGELRVGGIPVDRPLRLRSPKPLVFPQNLIAASGVLVDRGALLAAGGTASEHRLSEDLDTWLRLLARGPGAATSLPVVHYHHHPAQKSRRRQEARAAQRAMAAERTSGWSWSGAQLRRRAAMEGWDDLRLALREGDRSRAGRELLGLLAPRRAVAVLLLLRWRALNRRVGRRHAARLGAGGGQRPE